MPVILAEELDELLADSADDSMAPSRSACSATGKGHEFRRKVQGWKARPSEINVRGMKQLRKWAAKEADMNA